MSTTTSLVPYNLTCLHVRSCCRLQTVIPKIGNLFAISKRYDQTLLYSFSYGLRKQNNGNKMNMIVYSSVEPGPQFPSDPSPSSWKVWILGMIMTIIIPFWRNKWGPLLRIKREVETAIETAEFVADIVENVAEDVEKVAEEIADHLPEGGKLKDAVTFVENVAKETAKDVHLAEQVLEKIEEVEKEVESFIEPIIDQADETTKEAKD